MSEKTGGELPRTLEVLWGHRAERRARGPAQPLSLDRIVAAAIAIADTDGLPALSMARLAERLGCATMSLYRHVANKDELRTFMLDAAPGPPPDIPVAPSDWRGQLHRWALELAGVYHRHPWILQTTAVGPPPLEPGQLAWMDAGLRTLGGTALSPHEKMSVLLLVMHYVRGHAQLSTNDLRTTPDQRETPASAYEAMLTRLIDPTRFPALAELLTAGVFGDPDTPPSPTTPTPHFTFGLDRILDGIETLIPTRPTTTPPYSE
ncbi:TetR/AcrR family transcriptional regulator [Sphaerisporangium aureirubrum]|uniref:TetR/AcrR family transcriptional regulator n=1 Tax=Sphaerisporangium aureirubrum TaxID=1544736 RepID=A0ABW1NM67_9ACTN